MGRFPLMASIIPATQIAGKEESMKILVVAAEKAGLVDKGGVAQQTRRPAGSAASLPADFQPRFPIPTRLANRADIEGQ